MSSPPHQWQQAQNHPRETVVPSTNSARRISVHIQKNAWTRPTFTTWNRKIKEKGWRGLSKYNACCAYTRALVQIPRPQVKGRHTRAYKPSTGVGDSRSQQPASLAEWWTSHSVRDLVSKKWGGEQQEKTSNSNFWPLCMRGNTSPFSWTLQQILRSITKNMSNKFKIGNSTKCKTFVHQGYCLESEKINACKLCTW